MGSRVYEGHQAHGDAACVALLREAGAIILGKTVTCEFAGVAPSITRNPLNPAHTPGGSSSGSAAAVADFMVPAALGTQTSGSVLRPASFCGVIGFKPTFNTINREGTKLASENLDTIGVITRHVEDAALLLQVMTRSAPHPLQGASFAPRLGLCRTVLCDEKVEPATRTILENAAAKARAAGATVIDFELPADFVRIGEARVILDCVERSRGLASEWTHHRMSLSPQLVAAIERGLATSQSDYQDALRFLESTRQCFDMLIECFDGLITPTVNGEAPYGMGSTGDAALQGFWTALYAPTISIPAGVGPASMPIGLQLVARRYADEKLLEVALWMQQKAGIVATAL